MRAGSAAFATMALEVSATSGRAAIALVIEGAGCEGPAEASFIGPALTWTVLTLTGFIGSAEHLNRRAPMSAATLPTAGRARSGSTVTP